MCGRAKSKNKVLEPTYHILRHIKLYYDNIDTKVDKWNEREIRLRPVNDKEKSNDGHGSVRKKMISQ